MKILIRFEFFAGGVTKIPERRNDVVFEAVVGMEDDGTIDVHVCSLNRFIIFLYIIYFQVIIPLFKYSHSTFLPGVSTVTNEKKNFLWLCRKIINYNIGNSYSHPSIKGCFH